MASSPSPSSRPAVRAAALASAGAAVLALAACAPDLGPRPQPKPLAAYATQKTFQAPPAPWPSQDWWTRYGDPELDALVAEALKGSPSLAQAQARLRAAEAQAMEAGAALVPQVTANGQLQEARQSLNMGYPPQFQSFLPHGWNPHARATLDLQWQLDFFGRNRAALAAATSEAEAAAADAAAARLQLSTAVATAYADLARLYAERDDAEAALKVRQQTSELVGQRLENGLETRGAFAQVAANVPAARRELTAIDQQIEVTRHQLAALMGEGPDRGLAIPRPKPGRIAAFGLPPALGAELIGRRPDVAAARLRAEAAARRIKVARADYYPNIDLIASYGLESLGLGMFLDHNSQTGAAGAAVTLPIFQGRRLEGRLRGARAEYDAAVASYDQALTQALRETADAITGSKAVSAQLADARSALASSEEAYRVARLRYEGGLATLLDVLTAENAVLANRRIVTDLQAQALSADVALVRALGGGYRAG
jgi:NodT family efflux transporter outer membrane factor (OMF) lipoprotein